jgi:6,7-dimethyl-8-ribityllumazine synthase
MAKISVHKTPKFDGSELKISIILPRFNEELGLELFAHTQTNLVKSGVKIENINLIRVPGTLEIPFVAQQEINKNNPDALIALGIVIRGESFHFELVCNTAHNGLMQVSLMTETPVIFGILTVENLEQALKRIAPNQLNKAEEYAHAAIEMGIIKKLNYKK